MGRHEIDTNTNPTIQTRPELSALGRGVTSDVIVTLVSFEIVEANLVDEDKSHGVCL